MEVWLAKFMEPLVWFGLAGQGVFMARFVLQWYVSERRGRSHVPVGFWWLSVGGGLMLTLYGVLDRDPVVILGQSLGLAIYARNLVLIYRRKARYERIRAAGARGGEERQSAARRGGRVGVEVGGR